ncbi:hypothetical protein MLD38_010346 [Melastoma candidum]|uniref:Uncharacterized protein n=1 Tax=Melastoma candidum TaxID=119954 RepID=A0ACB9R3M4_9MYRT|nr:hypothetical protein MLD38_010346 [Melastoma candidum]
MDESWRTRIGTSRARHDGTTTAASPLDPEDFSDVFGGPPRTVLLRKFSADRKSNPSSLSFHGLMPRPPGVSPTSRLSEVFYDEAPSFIGERMSRDRSGQASNGLSKSKSKSNSSSEELSPLRPSVGDDVGLSSFGPKLRPIDVSCRWNCSVTDFPSEHHKMKGVPVIPCGRPFMTEDRLMEDLYKHSNFESPPRGLSRQSLSPETFTAEPNSNRSSEMPAEDEEEVKAASRSSVISGDGKRVTGERDVLTMSDEDDEISSSYVIEITPGIRNDAGKTPRIDEVIAWDTERFLHDNAQSEGSESWGGARSWKEHIVPETKEKRKPSDLSGILCGKSKSLQNIEFEALDRNMKFWTSGTEKDIRQLLSTLHQIMWPNSGWEAVPLTNLRESSQLKKAYLKARQCLQPDWLQQRGATFPQKYIAHKALAIIQDSWTKYISEGDSREDQITIVDR